MFAGIHRGFDLSKKNASLKQKVFRFFLEKNYLSMFRILPFYEYDHYILLEYLNSIASPRKPDIIIVFFKDTKKTMTAAGRV